MPASLENMQLDTTNEEFNQAIEFVKNTDKLIFLTGKAGTGKTTFLKYIKTITNKNTVIVAPTGVAAMNAGGVTISSFFQIPFGPFVPNDKRLRIHRSQSDLDQTTIYTTFKYREEKRAILEGLQLLIIDEVSMVRSDTLDVIDTILRVFRKNPFVPFGGVQVILIGDAFQLPPIASEKSNEGDILGQFYQSKFFFSSKVMHWLITQKKYVHFELKKIYRQNEQEFIDLLNRIRVNQVIESDIRCLDEKYNPAFYPNENENYIVLSTHNFQVDQTNSTKLDELKSDLKIFKGELEGEYPKDYKGNYILPTELNLHLKEGAQVMFLKNDTGEIKRYYNGKIGKIKSLENGKIIVEVDDGISIPVDKTKWTNIEYVWDKEQRVIVEKIKGTFIQFPLKLAWAITVHKSQGLTFEKVIADLGASFEDGQVYVALSRCTTLTGLSLKSKISRNVIKTNPHVIEFAQHETPSTLITQQLNEGKADFFYKKAREAYKGDDISSMLDNFKNALKFRNDIDTETFKRWLEVNLTRLRSTFISYKGLESHLEKSKAENIIINIEKSNLLQSLNEKESKLNVQNKAIKLLLDKVKDFEQNQEKSQQKINQLEDELGTIHDDLNKVAGDARKYEIDNKALRYTIQLQEMEVERLKNLKWYQRL